VAHIPSDELGGLDDTKSLTPRGCKEASIRSPEFDRPALVSNNHGRSELHGVVTSKRPSNDENRHAFENACSHFDDRHGREVSLKTREDRVTPLARQRRHPAQPRDGCGELRKSNSRNGNRPSPKQRSHAFGAALGDISLYQRAGV